MNLTPEERKAFGNLVTALKDRAAIYSTKSETAARVGNWTAESFYLGRMAEAHSIAAILDKALETTL